MTVKEKLQEEFTAAIIAIYGDLAEEDCEEIKVHKSDLQAIANKVAFYMDLD